MLGSIRLKFLAFSRGKITVLCLALSLVLGAYLVNFISFSEIQNSLFTSGLEELYDLRKEVSNTSQAAIHYIYHPATKGLLLFALLYCLEKKRYLGLVAGLIGILLFAVLSTQKSIVFIPVFGISIYCALRVRLSNRLYIWLGLLSFPILVGFIGSLLGIEELNILDGGVASIVVDQVYRRLYMIPSAVATQYYDFFVNLGNPIQLFSDSRISLGLIKDPYEFGYSVPHLISRHIGYPIEGHANNGMIGSGLQQLYIFGPLAYSLFLGLLANALSRLRTVRSYFAFSAAYLAPNFLWAFISTDLPAMFLTHGFAFVILFVIISRTE